VNPEVVGEASVLEVEAARLRELEAGGLLAEAGEDAVVPLDAEALTPGGGGVA